MVKGSDVRKRKKARARKKALAIPTKHRMVVSPPISKEGNVRPLLYSVNKNMEESNE